MTPVHCKMKKVPEIESRVREGRFTYEVTRVRKGVDNLYQVDLRVIDGINKGYVTSRIARLID